MLVIYAAAVLIGTLVGAADPRPVSCDFVCKVFIVAFI